MGETSERGYVDVLSTAGLTIVATLMALNGCVSQEPFPKDGIEKKTKIGFRSGNSPSDTSGTPRGLEYLDEPIAGSVPPDIQDLDPADRIPDSLKWDTNNNNQDDYGEDADLAAPGIQVGDSGLPPSESPHGGTLATIMQGMGMAMGAVMMPLQALFMVNMLRSMFARSARSATVGSPVPGGRANVCIAPEGAMTPGPAAMTGGNAVRSDAARLAGAIYIGEKDGSSLSFEAKGRYRWRGRAATELTGSYSIGAPDEGVPLTARFLMLVPDAPKGVGCIEMFTLTIEEEERCTQPQNLQTTTFPLPPEPLAQGKNGASCETPVVPEPLAANVAELSFPLAFLKVVAPATGSSPTMVLPLNQLDEAANNEKRSRLTFFYPENPDPTCEDLEGARWSGQEAQRVLALKTATIKRLRLVGQPIRKSPGKNFESAELPSVYDAAFVREPLKKSQEAEDLTVCNSSVEGKTRYDDARAF